MILVSTPHNRPKYVEDPMPLIQDLRTPKFKNVHVCLHCVLEVLFFINLVVFFYVTCLTLTGDWYFFKNPSKPKL
jgi:hypothetical protein